LDYSKETQIAPKWAKTYTLYLLKILQKTYLEKKSIPNVTIVEKLLE